MRVDLLIDGRRRTAERYSTVVSPYDGEPVGEAPRATPGEVDLAVAAAVSRKSDAAGRTMFERYEWLSAAARLLEARAEEFARLIAAEAGKPLREARTEVRRARQTLVFSAEEARRVHGEAFGLDGHPDGKGRFAFTIRRPRGVIAAITPFNFPLNLVCHKVGPAIAAGCTVVLKPDERTPLCAHRLADLLTEAGLPAGYLNVVGGLGSEIGDHLTTHAGVDMVSFTGSAAVGRRIRAGAGLRPVTLELGGNSAVIVEADSDLDHVLERCRTAGFGHSGQVCIHLQRVYVAEAVLEGFAAKLAAKAATLRAGHPLDETAEVTGLITPAAADRVGAWIGEAVAAGARKLIGGGRTGRATVEPTVFADVPEGCRVVSEEVFGPVVSVAGYRDLREAVARVNRSRLGLQAGLFTRDLDKALWAAERLEVGGVMVNDVPTFRVDHMPYGGTRDSGTGREGPRWAIEEMTELRTVVVRRRPEWAGE